MVVNDWVTDDAIIDGFTGVAKVLDTTFQKYVMPGCNGVVVVHEYVVGGSVVSCAGTLATTAMFDVDVPRYTS